MDTPLLTRLLLGLLQASSSHSEMAQEQRAEGASTADLELLRELRAARMDATNSGAQHTRAPYILSVGNERLPPGAVEGMVRMASKEAGISFSGAAGMIGGAMGRGVRSTAGSVSGAATGAVRGLGRAMTPKTPGSWSASPPKPTTTPAKTPAPVQAPKPAPPTPASFTDKVKQNWQQSGLSEGAKWKVPALGAMALGTYGAVRGAKGLANVMGREATPSNWNGGGLNPAYGVNAYGYPDRATPFSY